MTVATLSDVLIPAMTGGYAVPGFVVLGWEEARAFVAAGEAEGSPVILQAGPGARAYMPLPVFAAMFRTLAEAAAVPVVAHLDHGRDLDECRAAVELGFTSVMYDGSHLPLNENIARTASVTEMARSAGVSVEAELGVVGYAGEAQAAGTDPDEAARFCLETAIDALAVAVGNVHLMTGQSATIDMARLREISVACPVPLVLHGGSGIPDETRRLLATTTGVCKFNVGTELRQVFGAALRQAVARDPARFDRIAILFETIPSLVEAARAVIRTCRG